MAKRNRAPTSGDTFDDAMREAGLDPKNPKHSLYASIHGVQGAVARLEEEARNQVRRHDTAKQYEFSTSGSIEGGGILRQVVREELAAREGKRAVQSPEETPAGSVRRKAPDSFVAGLISVIADMAKVAGERGLDFVVSGLPGTRKDFLEVAKKLHPDVDYEQATFDTYVKGLLSFRKGSRTSRFYRDLFPDLFK